MRGIDKRQYLDPYCKLFEQRIQKFPGALPVAITKTNKVLLHYGFLCALKADGERVFAIVADTLLVLHYRDGHTTSFELSTKFQSCLFDCEYISKTNTLLIFDTLICNERATTRLSIEQRIEIANFFLSCIVPRQEQGLDSQNMVESLEPIPTAYKWARVWKIPNGPCVQCKPLYNFHDVVTLWQDRKELPYPCDGIIFTRLLCAYSPFNQNPESVFKWKPNVTIDFLVMRIQDTTHDQQEGYVVDPAVFETSTEQMIVFLHPRNEKRSNYRLFAINDDCDFVCVSRCHLNDDSNLSRCVCEFSWQNSRWALERTRKDKKTPNHLNTVISSFQSILDGITIDDLIKA